MQELCVPYWRTREMARYSTIVMCLSWWISEPRPTTPVKKASSWWERALESVVKETEQVLKENGVVVPPPAQVCIRVIITNFSDIH